MHLHLEWTSFFPIHFSHLAKCDEKRLCKDTNRQVCQSRLFSSHSGTFPPRLRRALNDVQLYGRRRRCILFSWSFLELTSKVLTNTLYFSPIFFFFFCFEARLQIVVSFSYSSSFSLKDWTRCMAEVLAVVLNHFSFARWPISLPSGHRWPCVVDCSMLNAAVFLLIWPSRTQISLNWFDCQSFWLFTRLCLSVRLKLDRSYFPLLFNFDRSSDRHRTVQHFSRLYIVFRGHLNLSTCTWSQECKSKSALYHYCSSRSSKNR